MNTHETVTFVTFSMSALAFAASMLYLLRIRNKAHSIGQFLLAGPMLFIAPQRFFPVGKRSAPWQVLLLWACILVVLLLLQKPVVAWLA